jgi:hypothetical protein
MKCKYRKAVSYIERGQGMKLNVLQVMHVPTAAWNSFKPETIANCFKKAVFNCSNSI